MISVAVRVEGFQVLGFRIQLFKLKGFGSRSAFRIQS